MRFPCVYASPHGGRLPPLRKPAMLFLQTNFLRIRNKYGGVLRHDELCDPEKADQKKRHKKAAKEGRPGPGTGSVCKHVAALGIVNPVDDHA